MGVDEMKYMRGAVLGEELEVVTTPGEEEGVFEQKIVRVADGAVCVTATTRVCERCVAYILATLRDARTHRRHATSVARQGNSRRDSLLLRAQSRVLAGSSPASPLAPASAVRLE